MSLRQCRQEEEKQRCKVRQYLTQLQKAASCEGAGTMAQPLRTLLGLYSVIHYHAYFIAGITKTELCVIFVVCLYNYTLKPQLDFFLNYIFMKSGLVI